MNFRILENARGLQERSYKGNTWFLALDEGGAETRSCRRGGGMGDEKPRGGMERNRPQGALYAVRNAGEVHWW